MELLKKEIEHILKNDSKKIEFNVNGWSKITFWCDIFSQICLSLE